METMSLVAVTSIAIVCLFFLHWLFCVIYFFGFLYDKDDDVFLNTSKVILAILIGWVVTPIILGIEILKSDQ